MIMNKLQIQLLHAIFSCDKYNLLEDGSKEFAYTDIPEAKDKCAEITIEHMKGFAEWVMSNLEKGSYNELYSTIDELIQLYFDSLNK